MAATVHVPRLALGKMCAVHPSPLSGQRSPTQCNRTILEDLGAFLSRPSPRIASRTSPRTGLTQALSTRGGVVRNQDGFEVSDGVSKAALPAKPQTKQALTTRGGVVRNQDGFEAFYGVSKAALPAKPQTNKASERDGYDIFFGIRTRDRTNGVRQIPMPISARSPASNGAADVRVQEQVESQLQSWLARPVPSQEQTSSFVPVGRSVSDSVMLHYACGYEPRDLTIAQVAQADMLSIPAVREEEDEEEEEDERREPVECAKLGDELSALPMAPKSLEPKALSSQAQLVKGVEVFSMHGCPTPGLVPTGVLAFDLTTPRTSVEPPMAHRPVNSA